MREAKKKTSAAAWRTTNCEGTTKRLRPRVFGVWALVSSPTRQRVLRGFDTSAGTCHGIPSATHEEAPVGATSPGSRSAESDDLRAVSAEEEIKIPA